MTDNHSNANKLILGAILGSLVTAGSAVYLSSKSGQALKDDSSEKLHDIKEKVEDFLKSMGDKTHALTDEIHTKTEGYSDKIHEFALQVSEQIKALGTDENKEKLNAFLIGGIVGGILGAKVASCTSSQGDNTNSLFKNVGSAATSLKHTVQEILNVIDEHPQAPCRSNASCEQNQARGSIEDVLNFVSTGVKIWQRMQKSK